MNADIFALLLKVSTILATAAVAALVLRRSSAAWRHFVWSAAMTSVIVLVVLQLIVPPIIVRVAEGSLLRAFATADVGDVSSGFASPALNATEISATVVSASMSSREAAVDAITTPPIVVHYARSSASQVT
ncbi:MAG: hypothetical protein ABI852_11700, partial [Gemmatimonadaceae bacterium]